MGPGIALLAAGAVTMAGQIAKGKTPRPRIIIGAAIAGGALVGLGQASPEVASRFATLILVTALLTSGADLATGVRNLTK